MPTARVLLTQIKNVLLQYQSAELRGVVTYKRGVLPPQPAFPALAIMPELATFGIPLSNGKYEVRWQVNLELFANQRTPDEAMDTVRLLANNIKQIVRQNPTWGGIAIDTEIFAKEYEELIPFMGQFMQIGSVPIEILTYEQMPPNLDVRTEFRYTDSVDLIKAIFERLIRQKNERLMSLGAVAEFYRAHIPPIPTFPAVTLIEPVTNSERVYTGLDANTRTYHLNIFTRLADQELNLDANLDILETVIDILQVYYSWGGRTINSLVQKIEFARETTARIGAVYRTTIEYMCQSPESTTLPTRTR